MKTINTQTLNQHVSMITFIFKVIHKSDKRGYNREVLVYRIKNNEPLFIGCDDEINTASYRGDRAIANWIIANELGFKMANNYDLKRKDVRLFEI